MGSSERLRHALIAAAWGCSAFTHDPCIRRSRFAFGAPSARSPAVQGVPRARAHIRTNTIATDDDEECPLMPEINPNFDPSATSLSDVSISDVIAGIDRLYPPSELESRNAKSRTDGYWKYVEKGESPPQEFTYGEFDVDFFSLLLDRAWELYQVDSDEMSDSLPWQNKTFIDIGSGAGRLVLSAAALHPNWKLCRGLEILEGIHNTSTKMLDICQVADLEQSQSQSGVQGSIPHVLRGNRSEAYLPLAPIEFVCGSFTNPYEYIGDVDVAFVFSSCMKPELIKQLSNAIGRQFKPGSIVITTEFPLHLRGSVEQVADDRSMPHGEFELQLLEKINGWCWLLGGESTAYIHRVKTSLHEQYGGPRQKPKLSVEEEAFQIVQKIENGTLTDTDEFIRQVKNDMFYHGVDATLRKADKEQHIDKLMDYWGIDNI